MTAITWLFPGILVSMVVAALLSKWAGQKLQVAQPVAWLLMTSIGLVIAATLTPIGGSGPGARLMHECDLARLGLPSPSDFTSVNDTSLNVALFVPLGIALGLAVRRRSTLLLVAAAVVSPVLIESAQFALPQLNRGCQSADVVDNLLGLALGLGLGWTLFLAGSGLTGSRRS